MQTLATSTLSLPTKSIAAESSAGVASFVVGTAGTEGSFAEVFLGQATGLSGQAATGTGAAQPQTIALGLSAIARSGNIDPAAEPLPLFAATGKILPLPGKGEANGEAVAQMPTVTPPIVAAYVTTPTVSLVPVAKPGLGNPVEEAAPDGTAGDREVLYPALAPAAHVLSQTLSLPDARALTGATVLTKTDTPSAPIPPSLGPAKLDAAPQPNATVAAPQAPSPSVPAAPTASATPIAGQIAVLIAAKPVAAAGPTEQTVNILASDERSGQPAAPVPATAQLTIRAAAANTGSGETSHRGAREGAPRRDSAVGAAAPVVSAASATAADLLPAVSAPPTLGADRATASPLPTAFHVIPTATPDRAEAIANVVDRLMAAREVGLGALASVAIENRDFGDLTVNFSDKGHSLEVSVTAADADKQRALAAALATTERPVTREPTTQTTQASSNGASTAMQQDRGAEGQFARDSGGRQPRSETMTEQRHAGQSAATDTETETALPKRSGIYV